MKFSLAKTPHAKTCACRGEQKQSKKNSKEKRRKNKNKTWWIKAKGENKDLVETKTWPKIASADARALPRLHESWIGLVKRRELIKDAGQARSNNKVGCVYV
jgi:hypothetical protein